MASKFLVQYAPLIYTWDNSYFFDLSKIDR